MTDMTQGLAVSVDAGELAVFVDFENIRYSTINSFGREPDPLLWRDMAMKHGLMGVARAYADFDQHPDAVRTRKLLLHSEEISKLIGKVERAGYTLVPLNLHFSKGRIKCEVGLAKGKKQHDKRETERLRDTQREIQSAMKQNRR